MTMLSNPILPARHNSNVPPVRSVMMAASWRGLTVAPAIRRNRGAASSCATSAT